MVPKVFIDSASVDEVFAMVGEVLGQPDLFRLLRLLQIRYPERVADIISRMVRGPFCNDQDREIMESFRRAFGLPEEEVLELEEELAKDSVPF